MFKRKRNILSSGNAGCSFMVMTGFLICALLLINGLLVKAFVSSNLSHLDVRISQAAQFILPIIMIFVEFYIFDLMTADTKPGRSE